MKPEPLKIGLIGCGHMGGYYAHNLSRIPGSVISACCDPSREKLNCFRQKWNIESGTTDWRDLLTGCDGLINCSTDSLHEEVFKACCKESLPLLTEKPFAVTADTLSSFTRSELESHKFVINFSKRVIPSVAGAREFIRTGGLGKVHRAEMHYRQGWVLNHDFGDWKDTSAWLWRLSSKHSHHGVLGDLGSHLIDLSSFFFGPAKSIFCSLGFHSGEIDEYGGFKLDSADEARCILDMKNGVSVLLNATRTFAGERDSLEILVSGEKGSVKVNPEKSKNSYEQFLINDTEWRTVPCNGRIKRNFEHFIDVIGGTADPEYPGMAEALSSQAVMDSAVISAGTNRTVKVGDSWDRFH